MLANHKPDRLWSREGGPFDIIAITVSLIVIVGAVVLVNSASMRYRMTGTPVASHLPVLAPSATPDNGEKPRQ
jgi:hypothetical protein